MKNTIMLCLALTALKLSAQNHETQYWARYKPRFEFKKVRIDATIEDRFSTDIIRRNLLANLVILYKFNENFNAGAGFAHFTTYDDDKNHLSIPELRPFQQIGISHKSGKLAFDHRFRAEERFIRDTIGNQRTHESNYTFRGRYRLELTWSVYKNRYEQGNFGFQVKDEIFISAGPIKENYDQNRLYGGIVWQMSKQVGFELGYLWQNRNLIDMPDMNNDIVRFTITHKIDFRKTSEN